MRLRKILLPFIVVATGVAAFIFLKSTKPENEPLSVEVNHPVVSAQLAVHGAISPSLSLFGQVETPAMTTLTAAIAGEIVSVSVQEGSRVNEGELLVQIDQEDARLLVEQKQADVQEIEAMIATEQIKFKYDKSALEREEALLGIARKAVQRAKKLAANKLGSDSSLDSARQQEQQQLLAISQRQRVIDEFPARQKQLSARLIRSKAELKRKEKELSYTRILSPFDAVVSQSSVSQGDWVNKGKALVELYNSSRLELRVQVPNRFIWAFADDHQGDGANGKTDLSATTMIDGKQVDLALDRLSGKVASGKGGVDAFFLLPQGVSTQVGRTLEVEVILPAYDGALSLPVDALYGSNKIYIIESGKLMPKAVERLGQHSTDQGQAVIIDGRNFEGGEQILTSRLPQATEGLRVDVIPTEE